MMRILQRKIAMAFGKWRDEAAAMARQAYMLGGAVRRLLHRMLSMAWEKWQYEAAEMKRRVFCRSFKRSHLRGPTIVDGSHFLGAEVLRILQLHPTCELFNIKLVVIVRVELEHHRSHLIEVEGQVLLADALQAHLELRDRENVVATVVLAIEAHVTFSVEEREALVCELVCRHFAGALLLRHEPCNEFTALDNLGLGSWVEFHVLHHNLQLRCIELKAEPLEDEVHLILADRATLVLVNVVEDLFHLLNQERVVPVSIELFDHLLRGLLLKREGLHAILHGHHHTEHRESAVLLLVAHHAVDHAAVAHGFDGSAHDAELDH